MTARCVLCNDTGTLTILATLDDVPWDVAWQDTNYRSPCNCAIGART